VVVVDDDEDGLVVEDGVDVPFAFGVVVGVVLVLVVEVDFELCTWGRTELLTFGGVAGVVVVFVVVVGVVVFDVVVGFVVFDVVVVGVFGVGVRVVVFGFVPGVEFFEVIFVLLTPLVLLVSVAFVFGV